MGLEETVHLAALQWDVSSKHALVHVAELREMLFSLIKLGIQVLNCTT